GNYNTAVGMESMGFNIDGRNNTAVGKQSLPNNTDGDNNTSIGSNSLNDNISGYDNTAIGCNSMYYNINGYQNTAVGSSAFFSWHSPQNDTAYYNSTAIGYYSEIFDNNQVKLGNFHVQTIGGYANWTNEWLDAFKTDIQDDVKGLGFIMKLHPVTYNLDLAGYAKSKNIPDSLRMYEDEKERSIIRQTGFLAQDVDQAANELGFDFSGIVKHKNKSGNYGLRYSEFVVPLVKAVQEQQQEINTYKQDITSLEAVVLDLMTRLEKLENK
ncbi:MAG: hypothetical protein DRJ05_00385, partial [Bacteroidetes bacterium]